MGFHVLLNMSPYRPICPHPLWLGPLLWWYPPQPECGCPIVLWPLWHTVYVRKLKVQTSLNPVNWYAQNVFIYMLLVLDVLLIVFDYLLLRVFSV